MHFGILRFTTNSVAQDGDFSYRAWCTFACSKESYIGFTQLMYTVGQKLRLTTSLAANNMVKLVVEANEYLEMFGVHFYPGYIRF